MHYTNNSKNKILISQKNEILFIQKIIINLNIKENKLLNFLNKIKYKN